MQPERAQTKCFIWVLQFLEGEENHCPICAAARACQGLCSGELAVFRAVLGECVSVERKEHIIADARRCVYRITGDA